VGRVDEARIREEARYDGKSVLRTNTDLPAAEAALKYKQRWMAEHVLRSTKSVLQTRTIRHPCEATIRGHVFCSFLALVLRKELEHRLESNGQKPAWAEITGDLMNLHYAEVEQDGKRFRLRSEAQATCGRVFAAAGVALPPTVQQIAAPPTMQIFPSSSRFASCHAQFACAQVIPQQQVRTSRR
jgi:hypothetical protein